MKHIIYWLNENKTEVVTSLLITGVIMVAGYGTAFNIKYTRSAYAIWCEANPQHDIPYFEWKVLADAHALPAWKESE